MLVSQHNPAMSDIEQALTNSLARDGRGGMLGDLPMGGHKVENLAPGTEPTDAATFGQLSNVAAGEPGPQGPQGPIGPVDSHSQRALAALPNLVSAARNRAFTTTPIKIAGVGSSNMLNEDGGLSGIGNSPVEVAMRELKAALDPEGNCIWEFANFGENGSVYSSFGGEPSTNVEAYAPDLLIVCYGTNDVSPESFNVGQTRGLASAFMLQIYEFCSKNSIDVINMIPPAPHVGKSKQTRVDPSTGLVVTGRALNFTVPSSYPTGTFQAGQSKPNAPDGDLSVTFTGGNSIVSAPGTFGDSSLYPGAVINISSILLQPDVVNSGNFRIASISGDKSTLVIDKVMTVNAYDTVVAGDVAFTNVGPVKRTIWRIAVDPFTELTPSFTEAFSTIEVDGVLVEVTTREQLVSQDVRAYTALSPHNAVLLDVMYDYVRAVAQYGEDRYYPQPGNAVHWNDVCVDEVVAPAFRKLALSLIEAPASVVAAHPTFVPDLHVRPEGSPINTPAGMGINRGIDIALPDMESAVFRHPLGMVSLEISPRKVITHLTDSGLPFQRYALTESVGNATEPLVATIPNRFEFEGRIFGEQPGVGVQKVHISGVCEGGVVSLDTYPRFSTSTSVFTVTADGANVEINPIGLNTQLSYVIEIQPYVFGAFVY